MTAKAAPKAISELFCNLVKADCASRPPSETKKEEKAAEKPEGPPATLRELVERAQKHEKTYQHPGVTDGLFTLAEASRAVKVLRDGTVPVLTLEKCRPTPLRDDAAFVTSLHKKLGCIAELPLTGLALAGGAVYHLLMNLPYQPADIDLFLTGRPDEKVASRIINATAAHLHNYWRVRGFELHVYRNNRCITFRSIATPAAEEILPATVQIILKSYLSLSEILHDFDMGSSAMGFDGEHVYFTAMGRLAYEQSINVINLPRRRASYERRLIKYAERGTDICMPNLKTVMLPAVTAKGGASVTVGLLDIWYRSVNYTTAEILATRISPAQDQHGIFGPDERSSYGGPGEYYSPNRVAYANWKACSTREYNPELLCAFAKYREGFDITAAPASLAGLEAYFNRWLNVRRVAASRLIDMFGKEAAATLIAELVCNPSFDKQLIITDLERTFAERLALPFKLEAVEGDDLGQPRSKFGVRPVEPRVWYGAYYRTSAV